MGEAPEPAVQEFIKPVVPARCILPDDARAQKDGLDFVIPAGRTWSVWHSCWNCRSWPVAGA